MMDCRMWIQMKSYDVQNEDDVCDILLNNEIDNLENVFELVFKDVQNCFERQNQIGMDFVLLSACMVPLKIQLINSSISLLRGNKKCCDVYFLNVKNEYNEYFSSVVNTLGENDIILIFNGVLLRNSVTFKENDFIVNVCAENKSSVSLFKYGGPALKQLKPLVQLNLSKLTGSDIFSLYGCIKKIKKYTDTNYMLLRLQCCDKFCMKVHKYPNNVNEFKNISEVENIFGVQYDFASNKVDILVESPCKKFISLTPNQYIFLDNLKVKYVDDSDVISLHVKGEISNLKFESTDTGCDKSPRSPTKRFSIPNDLEPIIFPKRDQISSNKQPYSNIRTKRLKKQKSPSKTLPFSTKESKHMLNLPDSLSDDNSNVSPEDILNALTYKDDNNRISSSFSNKTQKKNICCVKENVINCSLDGTITPPLIENTPELFTSDYIYQSKVLDSINDKTSISTQCLGPCRLLSIEPNVYEVKDLVSGYCVKCLTFFQKYVLLRSSERNYNCPKCSTTVQLTFFFKMIFLYGKNERQAIEVCCYNQNAEYIIKQLSTKQIFLEDYLSNDNSRKLINTTMKSLISNKTQVYIVVEKMPIDNSFKLLKIDTK